MTTPSTLTNAPCARCGGERDVEVCGTTGCLQRYCLVCGHRWYSLGVELVDGHWRAVSMYWVEPYRQASA